MAWVKATINNEPRSSIFLNLSAVQALRTNTNGTTTVHFVNEPTPPKTNLVVLEEPSVLLRNAKETGGANW